ncbi:hypothetical protein AB0G60_03035 [Streptomyces angustmyceticus]|uniref:Uncharacterized protein n=1 Tax=Streptomyces angustmyceticus TaxID=285578 RepID=A0A5J4L6M3_9ACTN|nr:hypothetical protein [Streptomyces angustmyceticus]UAL65635.1 hypothetical protein K7396_02995 [Streptomyces angustmyceticus]GES27842.1 hypothetical protein San01_03290 [Streptomyces angustmyceticus]
MNRLRALAARLRRPRPVRLDSRLAAFEALYHAPAASRRNTRKEPRT